MEYAFAFTKPTPPRGMRFQVWVEFWLEDLDTHMAVDGYTVYFELVGGERESISDAFIWETVVPRPGRYYLCHSVRYCSPQGEWRGYTGGKNMISHAGIPVAASPFCDDFGDSPCDSREEASEGR